MDHFFDEAARILASEMPRRQALLRLGALIGGGILATLGANSAQAQSTCTPAQVTAAKCKPTQICCPGLTKPFCRTQAQTCCGNQACNNSTQQCCPGNGIPFCTGSKKHCCGSTFCKTNQVCCSGTQTCCNQCNQVGQCTGSPS
jgi:hypothetical protein